MGKQVSERKMQRNLVVFFFSFLKIFEGLGHSWFSATYSILLFQKGLSWWRLFLPNVTYHFTLAFIDPVTGYLGDVFGHVRIYLIGLMIFAFGDLIYFFGDDLVMFNIAEFIVAIGASLMSDALESWLTNKIGYRPAHKVRSFTNYIQWLGLIPAVVGGFVAQVNVGYPFLLAAVTSLGSMLLGVFFFRRLRHALHAGVDPIKGTFRWSRTFLLAKRHLYRVYLGIHRGWKSPEFRYALTLNLVTYGAYKAFDQLWAVVLSEKLGGEVWFLGFFWIPMSLSISFGFWRARNKTQPQKKEISFWLVAVSLCLLAASLSDNPFLMMFFLVLHEVPRAILRETIRTYADKNIESRMRATGHSVISSARWFGGGLSMLFAFLLGELGIIQSPHVLWIFSAFLLTAFAVFMRRR